MSILTQDMYDYIKLNNIEKVEEYLLQINQTVGTVNLNKAKLESLLGYAIDWKRLEIIELIIQYSYVDPDMFNRLAMYYAIHATNAAPSNSVINYLREGLEGLEEDTDVRQC